MQSLAQAACWYLSWMLLAPGGCLNRATPKIQPRRHLRVQKLDPLSWTTRCTRRAIFWAPHIKDARSVCARAEVSIAPRYSIGLPGLAYWITTFAKRASRLRGNLRSTCTCTCRVVESPPTCCDFRRRRLKACTTST